MTLDDVYGAGVDRFPLEQDAANWESIELEWDDEEADITARFGRQLED